MNTIFPTILAILTQHRRHKVENIQWSQKLFTYNIFRLWELIFWRRCGKSNREGDTIRAEAFTHFSYNAGEITIIRRFYTWEALIAYTEEVIRKFFTLPKFNFRFVRVPQLITPRGTQFPLDEIFSFAIAFDVSDAGVGDNAGLATVFSVSHTTTGSDMILITPCAKNETSARTFTGVTYAAVAMTKIGTTATQDNVSSDTFLKMAPTTGANTLEATISGLATGPKQIAFVGMSYSGTAQTGQPDSSGTNALNASTVTNFSVSTTVVASNCWLSGSGTEDQGDIAVGAAGAGTTYRGTELMNMQHADSNGTVATGAQTLNWGRAGTAADITGAIVSIAPVADVVVSRPKAFTLLGIGQ